VPRRRFPVPTPRLHSIAQISRRRMPRATLSPRPDTVMITQNRFPASGPHPPRALASGRSSRACWCIRNSSCTSRSRLLTPNLRRVIPRTESRLTRLFPTKATNTSRKKTTPVKENWQPSALCWLTRLSRRARLVFVA